MPDVPQIELRVSRGEFVTVEVDPAMPPPDGWCLCRVERTGEPPTRGLVPWRFLVSAAHAQFDARAAQQTTTGANASGDDYDVRRPDPSGLDEGGELGGIEEVELGARLEQEVREVRVAREAGQLPIEVDERNVVGTPWMFAVGFPGGGRADCPFAVADSDASLSLRSDTSEPAAAEGDDFVSLCSVSSRLLAMAFEGPPFCFFFFFSSASLAGSR